MTRFNGGYHDRPDSGRRAWHGSPVQDRVQWQPLFDLPEPARQDPVPAKRCCRCKSAVVLGMLLLAGLLLLIHGDSMLAFLKSMQAIGPGNTDEDKAWGLVALSLVGILIVAVVRILTSRGDSS